MRWIYFASVFLIQACNSSSRDKISALENLPDSVAKHYMDSVAYSIEKSIPYTRKGFPTNHPDSSFYIERPYYDSTDKSIIKITVYETHSDTFIQYNHYYYMNSRLIAVRINRLDKNLGAAIYYFNNNHFIDSSLLTTQPAVPEVLLKKSNDLLAKYKHN